MLDDARNATMWDRESWRYCTVTYAPLSLSGSHKHSGRSRFQRTIPDIAMPPVVRTTLDASTTSAMLEMALGTSLQRPHRALAARCDALTIPNCRELPKIY